MNEVVFEGGLIRIGRWRLPASHPRFRDSGPTRGYLVVFPRTSTWIQHAGGRAFVADPNIVTFYNQHQEYTRRTIAPSGDRCEYYAVAPGLLRQIVAAWDPEAADTPERIIPFTHGPSDAQAYLAQRRVYAHVRREAQPDALLVEETMVSVLTQIFGKAYGAARSAGPPPREVVERAREVLARRFASRLTLPELAAATGASVFHLCRLFRASTGMTIHAYRNQLRLRAALERVRDSRADLSAIALDLGYSTHSHFTSAFRATYGITPSQARRVM